jgi:hypothetical protein
MYIINSGEIQPGILYRVNGEQSVIYNTIVYTPGQYLRGAPGMETFIYSGDGIQSIIEAPEIKGIVVEYSGVSNDQPTYNETAILEGSSVVYDLNDAEKTVSEVTLLKGFSLELTDYPFYSLAVVEIRL